MNVKIGDCIKTLVDKTTYMEDSDYFIVKKGSEGLVCEVYNDGGVLVEIEENDEHPFALVSYRADEYEKS